MFPPSDHAPAWEQLFSASLQLYTVQASASAGASSAAGACAEVSTAACAQQHGAQSAAGVLIGLAQLTWWSLETPAVLRALQAALLLKELRLAFLHAAAVTPGMLAALGRMTPLRSLQIGVRERCALPAQLVDAVANMQRLTRLKGLALDVTCAKTLSLLPTSLCALTVHLSLEAIAGFPTPAANLEHCCFTFLPRLVSLACLWYGQGVLSVDVPAGLTHLRLGGRVRADSVPRLLRHAELTDPSLCLGLLEALPALTGLVALGFKFASAACASLQQLSPVVSVLGCLKGLTSLSLLNYPSHLTPEGWCMSGLGRVLAQLPRLQDIQCEDVAFDAADALHLSVLTALTKLDVMEGGEGITDEVVTKWAQRLTDLIRLKCLFGGLKMQESFAALASMPNLRELYTYGNEAKVDDAGLMLFTTSTSLTRLRFDEEHMVSKEAMAEFLRLKPSSFDLEFRGAPFE